MQIIFVNTKRQQLQFSNNRMFFLTTVFNVACLALRIGLLVVLHTFHRFSQHRFESSPSLLPSDEEDKVHDKIVKATDISEMAEAQGYLIREHVVATKDNYLLVVHKLEKPVSEAEPIDEDNKKVAYFHHGLLTNSELFILGAQKKCSLPFLLVDLGYEVWLGNNRGNKYSRKHLQYSVSDDKFWDFSLDEFALYDVPDTISYVLSHYKPDTKLTYVGFSQGCSQLFASLSLKPELNQKLNLFVALSPAVVPHNLKHPVFKVIVLQTAKDNQFLFSLFGRRALMPSVSFWSYIMGSSLYQQVVDTSLTYLFGWSGKNISAVQKKVGYPHMFSNSSVKSLVHWFQIINAKRFQMYDETGKYGITSLAILSQFLKRKSHRVAPFPVSHHLNVPMVLAYGTDDILVDIESTTRLVLDQNPKMKRNVLDVIQCPGYEHMDTLWGHDVYDVVFSRVISTMESLHSPPEFVRISKLSRSTSTLQLNTSNVDSLYE